MEKKKQFLSTIFTWLVVIIIPYLVVSCLHGFKFNMDDWSKAMGFQYTISTLSLAGILATEIKSKK